MNYLKNLRLKRDLTQSQVADFLGISSQAYGYYEAGKRDMSLDTAKKLADFFNVPISFISGDSDFNSASVEELGVFLQILIYPPEKGIISKTVRQKTIEFSNSILNKKQAVYKV